MAARGGAQGGRVAPGGIGGRVEVGSRHNRPSARKGKPASKRTRRSAVKEADALRSFLPYVSKWFSRTFERPSPAQERRLDKAEEEAKALGLGRRVERKIASVALHTRGMDHKSAAIVEVKVTRLWMCNVDDLYLECRNFNGGVELLATTRNKGTALIELLTEEPSDTFCVYVGDDETDEDAFKQVTRWGAGIRVGAPGVKTNASGRLDGPKDVLRFLEEWIHVSAYAHG